MIRFITFSSWLKIKPFDVRPQHSLAQLSSAQLISAGTNRRRGILVIRVIVVIIPDAGRTLPRVSGVGKYDGSGLLGGSILLLLLLLPGRMEQTMGAAAAQMQYLATLN